MDLLHLLIFLDVPKKLLKERKTKNPNFTEEYYEKHVWMNHMAYVERIKYLPCRNLLLQRNEAKAQVCSMALQLINDACGVSGGVTRSCAVRSYRKWLRNKKPSRLRSSS